MNYKFDISEIKSCKIDNYAISQYSYSKNNIYSFEYSKKEDKGHFDSRKTVYDGKKQEEILLPISIFRNGLSGLEAISTYLKDNNQLRYCEIAKLLNRDDRTVWDAYNSAIQKSNGSSILEETNHFVPLTIFNNRSFSVLEALVTYLKEVLNLRYCKIAVLLNKDARTVWTAHSRAKKKRKNVA